MLQVGRTISIYVGAMIIPYRVEEATITTISEYFVRALRNEDSFGGEKGVLKFPQDDEAAWQILLHWKIKGDLPSCRGLEVNFRMDVLIRCWALGDKYDIIQFQDEIMWELIQTVEEVIVPLSIVRLAFDSTPVGSPLRALMLEELALTMGAAPEYKHEDLEIFDGVIGFSTALMQMVDPKYPHRSDPNDRQNRIYKTEVLKKFMVGKGPKKHFLHK